MNIDHQQKVKDHSQETDRSLTEEISFKEMLLGVIFWLKYLITKWKVILLIVILGGIINFLYVRKKPTLYVASSIFVLQESLEGSAMAGGNTFTSMIGLGAVPDASGIFQGDNLLELYKSRLMIKSALLQKIPDSAGYVVDRYMKINRLKLPVFKNMNFFKKGNKKYTRLQDSLMSVFVDDIRNNCLSVDHIGRLSMFRVEVRTINEDFSMLFNEQIVKTINDFYIKTKTQKSTETILLLKHQADSINAALNGAMYRVAAHTDGNINVNQARQVLRLPSQKSQVSAEINRAMLIEIVRNLEMSKMSLRKETPLIQILDGPVYPLEKRKPSVIKALLIGGAAAGVFATVLFSLLLLYKRILQ